MFAVPKVEMSPLYKFIIFIRNKKLDMIDPELKVSPLYNTQTSKLIELANSVAPFQ